MPAARRRRYATRQRSKTTVEATLHRTCFTPVEKLLHPKCKSYRAPIPATIHTYGGNEGTRPSVVALPLRRKQKSLPLRTATGQKIKITAAVQKTHNHASALLLHPVWPLPGFTNTLCWFWERHAFSILEEQWFTLFSNGPVHHWRIPVALDVRISALEGFAPSGFAYLVALHSPVTKA